VADVDLDPADPLVIRYRSLVAQIHVGAAQDGRIWRCGCGAPLPCPVVGLLLADLVKDEDRAVALSQAQEAA
jgi:hypothetical protein